MRKIAIICIIFLLIGIVIGARCQPSCAVMGLNPVEPKVGAEIIGLRTENSKTYYIGNSTYRAEISSGIMHYKDNYADLAEQWKDIKLDWKDEQYIDTAPYILSVSYVSNSLFFTDKKTGEIVSISPLDADLSDLTIIPFNEGVKLQRTISLADSAKALIPSSFTVDIKEGSSIQIHCSVTDADGKSLPIEYFIKDGKLIETITSLTTAEGKVAKFPITVDPTLYLQASKDNYLYNLSSTTNYGSSNTLQVGVDIFGVGVRRSLLELPVTWFPPGATLNSATLKLWYYGYVTNDPVGRTYNANILLRLGWEELTSTWNLYKAGSAWTIAGAAGLESDISGTYVAQAIMPAAYGRVSWDILNQAIWAYQSNKNVAVRIADNAGAASTYVALFYSRDHTTHSYRPNVIITYTLNAPTVTSSAATDITAYSATLNGEITNVGGVLATSRGFQWGTESGVYPYTWIETGSFDIGTFNKEIAFPPDTTIYWRAFATNAAGTGYSAERQFDTFSEPDFIVIIPGGDVGIVDIPKELCALAYDSGQNPLVGYDVEWAIDEGCGEFTDYDSATSNYGQAFAWVSSNSSCNMTIECSLVGYEINGSAEVEWLEYVTFEDLQNWLDEYEYTTIHNVEFYVGNWSDDNNVLMGGAGMPLWYILGLVALAVGAWFSQSIVVNIMLMIFCAGGFELTDIYLAFSEPLYYAIRGVLILGIVFALLQLFTRVKHI